VQGGLRRVNKWLKPRLPACPPSRKHPGGRGKPAGGRRKEVHAVGVHDVFFFKKASIWRWELVVAEESALLAP
jgi:hypothetical protein